VSVHPVRPDPKGITVRLREDSDELYFIYSGADRGVMINPAVLLYETGLFERNLVIAHDPWNAYYDCGVSRDVDSFDAMLEWQRTLCASLTHVRRLFCVGACMGGYAALAFGHLLCVEEVWAFGAVTVLPDGVDLRRARARAELAGRVSSAATAVATAECVDDVPELPPERSDLRLALQRSNGVTRYNLFFSEGHEAHAKAARHLADCDNVCLRPQPGDEYNVLQQLLDRALLPSVFVPRQLVS
jgi:hypothetical protein